MRKKVEEEVVIIGAGPAGVAAAVQLRRSGFDPLIFEKETVGDLLRNANFVENFLGFPDGITGKRLTRLLERHLSNLKVRLRKEEVLEIKRHSSGFYNILTKNRSLTARTVIIASGTRPKKFFHPSITADIEKRIFYEIHPFERICGKRFAIIGSGDVAFDFALNLSKKNEVYILNRKSVAKCLLLLENRASKNSRIVHLKETEIKEILFDRGQLLLTLKRKKGELNCSCDFIVAAIGREPELGFIKSPLLSSIEELERDENIHLIGDVKNGIYRQAAIAAADGLRAAMEIAQRKS